MTPFIKKTFFRIFILLIIILCIISYRWFFYYFTYSTDAYVFANLANINSIVSGHLQKVLVQDNQAVKKNQPLLQINPAPYEFAVSKAAAAVKAAQFKYAQAKNAIDAAQANLSEKIAVLKQAKDHLQRYTQLYKTKAVPQIEMSNAQTAVDMSQAEVNLAQQQLEIAEEQLNTTDIIMAQASLKFANFQLRNTIVRAPTNGYVTNLYVQPGDYVTASQPQFALIDNTKWWIIARFRETVVRRIKKGEQVKIQIDMFPGVTFHGVVDSIGWGINRMEASPNVAASTLAYLKPTEDWIRVAQRFPVRILITNPDPKYPLRIGASAEVKVEV